jgi:hypothetical protein
MTAGSCFLIFYVYLFRSHSVNEQVQDVLNTKKFRDNDAKYLIKVRPTSTLAETGFTWKADCERLLNSNS